MKDEKNCFAEVCIENLGYPLKVISKPNISGQNSIANISVRAGIEIKIEDKFEAKILSIINNRSEYIGPNQLSSKIVEYLDSINALYVKINFAYPYFIEKTSPGSNEKYFLNYECDFSIEKKSSAVYTKKYKVGIPIFTYHSLADFMNDRFDYPAKIIVEIEGLDTFFIEDIVEAVEDNVLAVTYNNLTDEFNKTGNKQNYNLKLDLIENIKKNLCTKHNINSCSVKLLVLKGQYSYSTKLTGNTGSVNLEDKYEGEHIFI